MPDRIFAATGSHGVNGELYELNNDGSVLTDIGPLLDLSANHYGCTGLAFDSSHDLFLLTGSRSPTLPRGLCRVDYTTAEVTQIGTVTSAGGVGWPGLANLADISFDSTDVLWSQDVGGLWTIDTSTAIATYQGNTAFPIGPGQGGALTWNFGASALFGSGSWADPPEDTGIWFWEWDFPYSLGTITGIGQTYPFDGRVLVAADVDSANQVWATQSKNTVNPSPTALVIVSQIDGSAAVQGSSVNNLDGIAILRQAATDVVLWVSPWWPAGFSPPPLKRFKPFIIISTADINPTNVTAIYAAKFGQPPSGSKLYYVCRSLSSSQQPNVHSPMRSFTVP